MHKYIRLMGSMVVQEYLVCAFFYFVIFVGRVQLMDWKTKKKKKKTTKLNVEEKYTEQNRLKWI